MDESLCPGCGSALPKGPLPAPERYNASRECWAVYGQLTADNLTSAAPAFPHQHAIDAYAAQHAGEKTAEVTVAFALIGLCLALEHGFSSTQVQRAHMVLAGEKRRWQRLKAPAEHRGMTVTDVVSTAVRFAGQT